jgi:glutamine---fructose-6-phosphate transaminase (isomerizing)
MDKMRPELITDQLETIDQIHRENFKTIDKSIRDGFTTLELASLHRVYALGDGDSYHATLATEMAFNEFAQLSYRPISAMHFLEYGADYIPVNFPRDTLVVGVSASGGSSRVVQSLERAKEVSDKVMLAGLVGTIDSRVAETAGHVLSVQIPELGRAPGIRTYAASLMGLIALAIRIGEINDHYHMNEANAIRQEITDMGETILETYEAAKEPAQEAAELYNDVPFFSFVGSGPSYGTAYFSSAKLIEAAGLFSVAQDLEEWAHVERFAYPLDYPVFMIAPPGKGYWRAAKLAVAVKNLGHPLIAVVDEDDEDVRTHADFVFPVKVKVRESLSPLLYYLAGTTFAYYLAKARDCCMFMSDNEFVMKMREQMRAQIQG